MHAAAALNEMTADQSSLTWTTGPILAKWQDGRVIVERPDSDDFDVFKPDDWLARYGHKKWHRATVAEIA